MKITSTMKDDDDERGFGAAVEAVDSNEWSISNTDFRSLIERIGLARSLDDVRKIRDGYAAAREPAFLEWLCLASRRGPKRVRETARVLWLAAEAMTRPKPPKALRSDWAMFERLFPANGSLPEGSALNRAIDAGVKLAAHKAFESGDEFFRLAVLRRTGEALFQRYQAKKRMKDLDDSIHLLSEATSESRTGSPSFTRASTYGGIALLQRYEAKRQRSDLETAVLVLRHAVANHENYLPPLLTRSGLALVRACIYQFEAGCGEEPLTEGLQVFLFVLSQSTGDLEEDELPQVEFSCFTDLFNHLKESGKAEALELLIEAVEESPHLRKQPYYLNQLAERLNDFYQRNGNLAILNRSITHLSNAAALGGPTLSLSLSQLGVAYKMRYYATRDPADIERSVESHRRALELLSAESPLFAMELDHYSQALRASYAVNGDASLLDRAVEMAERASQLMKKDDPERLTVLGNLINNLLVRGREFNRLQDLDRALGIADEALSQSMADGKKTFLSTARFNVLLTRFAVSGGKANLTAAKAAWAAQKSGVSSASGRMATADNWCRLMFNAGQFEEVVDGFAVAKEAARELIFVSETSEEGKRSWIQRYQWLVLETAYSLARLHRAADAVCEIEEGVALLLQEASWTRPGTLQRLGETGFEDLRERIEKAVQQLRYLSGAGASPFSDIQAARAEYLGVIAELQSVPEFSYMREHISIQQLMDTLPNGTLVCYLMTTKHGALILLVDQQGCETLWCDDFNEIEVGALNYGEVVARDEQRRDKLNSKEIGGWIGTYRHWERALWSGDECDVLQAFRQWQDQLDRTMKVVYDELMADLSAAADRRGCVRIVLVPMMTLSWWPLHAAWGQSKENGGEPAFALDSIPASYVPSVLTTLELAPSNRQQEKRSILAIGSPQEAGRPELDDAASEAELIAEGFAQAKILLGAQATAEAFKAASTDADIWHFAGHAYFHGEDEAALVFAGGTRIMLNEIGEIQADPPSLVVLSACESGVFDKHIPNERKSLAVAFLELGTRHVIATLWPVDDRASLLFMSFFYDELRTTGAIDALAKTQRWMRSTTDGAKKRWVRMRIEHATGAKARSGLLRLYRDLALREEAGRYYSEGYFWAGYQILGMETSL